jgi:hypothetical protein
LVHVFFSFWYWWEKQGKPFSSIIGIRGGPWAFGLPDYFGSGNSGFEKFG